MNAFDEAWRARFKHRPLPHVWSDEAIVLADVMMSRLKAADTAIAQLNRKFHDLENKCGE
jgi:hypothetical protein